MNVAAAAAALVLAALPVPELTGPVVDRAGVISREAAAQLDQVARAARAAEGGRGPQLAFLTVPSLEGEPIEDFSIRVAEAWQLGGAEEDNGVLFVVAVDDRRMRIEVGNGVEGELTDAQSGRIIRETMAPAFRQGDYGAGLVGGAVRALGALGVDAQGLPAVREPRRQERRRGSPVFVLLIFAAFALLRVFGGRHRHLFWMAGGLGGLGGRGFGGGRGGGGGFRGGGGGFSGGGASGSW